MAAAVPLIAPALISTAVGAVASKVMTKKPKTDPAVAASQKRQEALLQQQEAAQNRQSLEADKREEELSGQAASQRRAVAARRRGRGGLAYTPASSNLKNTLGG